MAPKTNKRKADDETELPAQNTSQNNTADNAPPHKKLKTTFDASETGRDQSTRHTGGLRKTGSAHVTQQVLDAVDPNSVLDHQTSCTPSSCIGQGSDILEKHLMLVEWHLFDQRTQDDCGRLYANAGYGDPGSSQNVSKQFRKYGRRWYAEQGVRLCWKLFTKSEQTTLKTVYNLGPQDVLFIHPNGERQPVIPSSKQRRTRQPREASRVPETDDEIPPEKGEPGKNQAKFLDDISTLDCVRAALNVIRNPIMLKTDGLDDDDGLAIDPQALAMSSPALRKQILEGEKIVSPSMTRELPRHDIQYVSDSDEYGIPVINGTRIQYSMKELWELYFVADVMGNIDVKNMCLDRMDWYWQDNVRIRRTEKKHRPLKPREKCPNLFSELEYTLGKLDPVKDRGMLNFWNDVLAREPKNDARISYCFEEVPDPDYLGRATQSEYRQRYHSHDMRECHTQQAEFPAESLTNFLFSSTEAKYIRRMNRREDRAEELSAEATPLGHSDFVTGKQKVMDQIQQERYAERNHELKRFSHDSEWIATIENRYIRALDSGIPFNPELQDAWVEAGEDEDAEIGDEERQRLEEDAGWRFFTTARGVFVSHGTEIERIG
ncbi:hypothetical protein BDV95DRAFT_624199 [Massariosphaeria phaeospora]|uniref:Uncharacterized protein n=1 Tax=Massariosphaeria phaeospora TaxID=100035 RepID=A0A7C8I0V8_9PLEO|nr:hypothetical protein BDV95DRAFT_624199 [Massariosphaeria phaeospora]